MVAGNEMVRKTMADHQGEHDLQELRVGMSTENERIWTSILSRKSLKISGSNRWKEQQITLNSVFLDEKMVSWCQIVGKIFKEQVKNMLKKM